MNIKKFLLAALFILATTLQQVPAFGQTWIDSKLHGALEIQELHPRTKFLILPSGTSQEVVTIEDGMNLSGKDLSGQSFTNVKIEDADFSGANLSGADFRQGVFVRCDFSNAKLFDVEIDGAIFVDCKLDGFIFDRSWGKRESEYDFSNELLAGAYNSLTGKQLAQSLNARYRDYCNLYLEGMTSSNPPGRTYLDFKDYDFSNSFISDCHFINVDFTRASFENAVLHNVSFDHCLISLEQIKTTWNYRNNRLDSVVLPRAIQREIDWEEFLNSQSFREGKLLDEEFGKERFFTQKQLQSFQYAQSLYFTNLFSFRFGFSPMRTARLDDESLKRVRAAREEKKKCFYYVDIDGWDLSGFDLSDSIVVAATALNTNFTDAIIDGAHFQRAPRYDEPFQDYASGKIVKEQLESTASYKQKRLQGVQFGEIFDLTQVDFSNCDLSNSVFLTDLRGANLTDAVITGCIFEGRRKNDNSEPIVTDDQIKSTWNYKTGHMEGIVLPTTL